MKEWSSKPAEMLTTTASTVGGSSGSLSVTSGTIVGAGSAAVSLTGGTSAVVPSTSSGSVLTQRVSLGAAVAAPVAAGVIVGGVGGICCGVANTIRYAKNEKTGGQAVKDTVKGATGFGVSAGLGVAAAHAVAGTALALGTTVLVPVAAGAAASCVVMKVWNKVFRTKCETAQPARITKTATAT